MEKRLFLISLLLLLLAVTGNGQRVMCFDASVRCEGSSIDRENVQDCCINRNGLAFTFSGAAEECIECIVIEWLNGTSFEGPEQTESYQFAVGYTKGDETLRAVNKEYTITATPMGTTENSDFQLATTSILVTPTTPAIVQITLLRDNVALEPNETVRLQFMQTVNTEVGEFLLNTIDVTIRDTDNVTLQFTEPEYVGSEMNMSAQVAVTIGGQDIQSPLVATVIPLNLSEVDGSLSPPAFDPLRPNRAQSFPEQFRDFNTTPITVTFQQGNTEVMTVNVGIEDDNVYEADEFFAVLLDAGDASPNVIVGAVSSSLCRIIDNDDVTVGFTTTSYTVSESAGSVNLSVVREGLTSQTVSVILNTTDGSAVAGEDYTGTTQTIIIGPGGSSRTVDAMVRIIDDNLLENVEQFTAQLSVPAGQDRVMLGTDMATVEITDNDRITIGFENETYSSDEGQGSVEVCVMDGGLRRDVEVTLATQNGSAVAGSDYQQLSVVLTFGEGVERSCVQIELMNDTILEGPESFVAVLSTLENVVTLAPDTAQILIRDDDAVTVQFDPTSYTVDESDRYANITIVRTGETAIPVTVNFVTADGSATAGEDYSGTTQTINIEPGNSSQTVEAMVQIIDDNLLENVEQFTAQLSVAAGQDRVMLGAAMATVDITDNDRITIGFENETYSSDEGQGSVEVCARVINGGLQRNVEVTLATQNGSAVAGSDYQQLTVVLTFGEGLERNCTQIELMNDMVLEGPESFVAVLSTLENVVTLVPDTAQILIRDDDAVTVQFDPTSYTVDESDRYANITVVKRGQTTFTVSVNFNTTDGSATAGEDYTATSVTVTFQAAVTSQDVMVPILADDLADGVEQFTARLSLPASQDGVMLGTSMATVEITDDDSVTVEFDPTSYTVSESDRFANITVVKRGLTTQTVNVNFTTADGSATAGQDYTTTSQTVTFAPSEDSRIVMVPIIDDNIGEGVEQFTAQLSLPAGQSGVVLGEDEATVEITDDDSVTVEFDPTSYTVDESDRYANITVVKRGQTTQAVSVDFNTTDGNATADEDYRATSMTVMFQAAETSQVVMVPILGDDTFEGVEQFTARLSVPPGQDRVMLGTDMATVEITDEEDIVVVEFERSQYTVSESDGFANITVVKQRESTVPISVEFTTADDSARAGEDYTAVSMTVMFQPTENSQVVNVPIFNDNVSEDVEQFTVELSLPSVVGQQSGGVLVGNTASVQIIDDDSVTVEFDPTSYTVAESGGLVNITVVKRGQTTQNVSVTFATADGTATAGQDYTTTTQTVTFAPSEDSRIVMVPIIDDNVFESVEQFVAQLFPFTQRGVVLGASMATVEITDDDSPPTTPPSPTTPPTTSTPPSEVNDTVIGDPLMTVPIRSDATQVGMPTGTPLSLCYEVHGQPDQYFNFVSDSCVSVNAHYTKVHPTLDINVINQIGVHAVDNSNQCHNIQADLSGCRALVDGVEITVPYRVAGISVRRFPNRVRIAVPNCENRNLVMWAFCQDASFSVPGVGRMQTQMIRFVISRGFALNESSHGILGQFWNVPITLEIYPGPAFSGQNAYIITFTHPDAPGPRRFVGVLSRWTWEKRFEICLYVGNRQAGPLYEVETPNDPVIEGVYTDYRVTGLFGTEYKFSHFDTSRCTT